ncbi:PREDICTED: trans-Golgi network integral membrane protein 1-like [Cyphomyrmex costatus]|uniref:Trans-Golgi network integral membrane protein 2 n=1 Tax=Cyphomyrmex costatus TaxID=456900 RepID=A0A195D4V2_9HYME|nr:PREDICTED: trans-Golgi network integral membrane protein 1-like [Cyphomyrmex costatus]KYN07913.1 Trans-Golgi network integral membrane protein 2 [Cyphomyrmex costatus]
MENRCTDLFRVILMLNCLVLFLSFTEGRSAPVALSVIDIMKNDSKICPTSQFLYDSKYTKLCANVAYPIPSWVYSSETVNSFLCLGVYDTAYKICQYSSQLQIPFNNTAAFNSYVEDYVLNENKQEDVCNNLQGFTPLYDKIDLLWGPLVENLNVPHKCSKICFDLQDKFQPLCAVLAWIKSFDDNMMKSIKEVETKHDLVTSDKPHISQSKDEVTGDIKTTPIESKKTETKEFKEQDRKQLVDSNDSVKKGNSNVPDNVPLTNVKSNREKTKFPTEKENNIQKKMNNTLETHKSASAIFKENKENSIGTELGNNAEVPKPMKNIPLNSDSQAPSINKAINNINENVKEENTQKSNKEQNVDDLKPSTLSENTQDHYDAANPEENMENDIDDVDDTIQHPDTGNQNENMQETFEQKNNNARLTEYSTMRTEDDSHFFTYFTVVTLACLAGYIGYHNKQKIFAIVLEGRRSRSNRGRRRPSTASYRKLDCTLEEAVTSQCNANVTHVIY